MITGDQRLRLSQPLEATVGLEEASTPLAGILC